MTITVLIDNALSPNKNLATEHGLSLYIDTGCKKILCDTGASELFAVNAESMNIDITQCDFTFISHGHNDHSGGLHALFEKVDEVNVYMQKNILHEQYFSSRKGEKRNISCDKKTLEEHKREITFISTTQQIAEGIFAVQCKSNTFTTPYGNTFLTKNNGEKEVFDNFEHELSLAFTTPKGLVIISPCSHCGVMNIIEECRRVSKCDKIHAFIGGFHFVEGDTCTTEAETFATTIRHHYPDTVFYTGHCTCDTAKEILAKRTENIFFFATGSIINV